MQCTWSFLFRYLLRFLLVFVTTFARIQDALTVFLFVLVPELHLFLEQPKPLVNKFTLMSFFPTGWIGDHQYSTKI